MPLHGRARRPLSPILAGTLSLSIAFIVTSLSTHKRRNPPQNPDSVEYIVINGEAHPPVVNISLLSGSLPAKDSPATFSAAQPSAPLPAADFHSPAKFYDSSPPALPPPPKNDVLAIVATFDDELSWLLEDDNSGQPVMPTEIYQIANLGERCEPAFPKLPRAVRFIIPGSVSAPPKWPAWAEAFVAEKCAMKDEAEPTTVFDVERKARLEAGLPWTARREGVQKRAPPKDSNFSALKPTDLLVKKSGNSSAAKQLGKDRPSQFIVPSISPLPLRIVPGMGRESMAYLTAIIDHYDDSDLPELLLFFHGHDTAWHTVAWGQRWMLQRLKRLLPRNLTTGYMPLGCIRREESFLYPRVVDANHYSENGPRWKETMAGVFMQAWVEHLGEAFGEPLPPLFIRAPCCATFAVTRTALRRRPKLFYIGLRNWLLTTNMDAYWAGVPIEFSWHMAFTGKAVYDPSVEQCREELYNI